MWWARLGVLIEFSFVELSVLFKQLGFQRIGWHFELNNFVGVSLLLGSTGVKSW